MPSANSAWGSVQRSEGTHCSLAIFWEASPCVQIFKKIFVTFPATMSWKIPSTPRQCHLRCYATVDFCLIALSYELSYWMISNKRCQMRRKIPRSMQLNFIDWLAHDPLSLSLLSWNLSGPLLLCFGESKALLRSWIKIGFSVSLASNWNRFHNRHYSHFFTLPEVMFRQDGNLRSQS